MKVRVSGKNVEVGRLAYGRETRVMSLFGSCARFSTRIREAEKAGSSFSAESGRSRTVVEVQTVSIICFSIHTQQPAAIA